MKIFKPTWVGHDGNPIFSVDIHPDGTRFATGGQGPDKCGRVIIWNMAPLLDESLEMKDDIPKILCQMDNHLACINCVRWSSKGKFLASAGDDKSLMVWQNSGRIYSNHQSSGQNSTSFAPANFEQWRCITTLHGHGGDILDLAWNPNDSYLASCSVDNLIIVWDVLNFPQVITKITGHTGLVKGVSWDPIGKYLASQSDDKTVRIWRTNDWREEVLIDEPFKECGGTTHVLRLGWSPDGQLLFSAHAMNNRGSTSQIIERDGWKASRDLVGHRKAITCVRPNPNILTHFIRDNNKKQSSEQHSTNSNSNGTKNNKQTSSAKDNKPLRYCCVAIGSRDRSLSVWLTNQPRPLTVAHDLFSSSVLDISWSPEGYHLIACSQDGSIAVIHFRKEELGQMLTQEEKLLHHQKLYGKTLISNNSKKQFLVEDADLLKAQEDQRRRHREIQDQLNQSSHSNSLSQNGYDNSHCRSGLGENNNSLESMSKGPTDKQIETLMPGGRRRITPIYLPLDGSPLPFNANNSKITFSSSKESKTQIMIEVRDDSRQSTTNSPQKASSQPLPSNNNISQQVIDNSPPRNLSRSPPMSTKPDSEHKQPQINGGQSLLISKTNQTQLKQPHTTNDAKNNNNNNNNKNASSSGVKRKLNPEVTSMINKKGKPKQSSQVTNNPPQTKQVDQSASFNTSKQNNEVQSSNQAATLKSSNLTMKKDLSQKFHMLPPLTIEKTADRSVCISDQVYSIEVENDYNSSKLAELRLVDQGNNRIWDNLLSTKTCALMASENVTVVTCIDHTLNLFDTLSGRRLRPPILLDSLVSHIAVEAYHVMVITSNSNLWQWDFKNNKAIIRNETIMPLLTQPTQDKLSQRPIKLNKASEYNNQQSTHNSPDEIEILSCSLTELYQPLLILSTGRSFLYDYDLKCWTLINDSNDLISKWSNQKSSISSIRRFLQNDNYKSNLLDLKKSLPLASIQSQSTFDITRHALMLNKNHSSTLQPRATSSFLDQQVAASISINSINEYRYWIIQSTQHFVNTGNEARLKDLCCSLMSSIFGVDLLGKMDNETSNSIIGLDKTDLLRDVLSIVATDLRYQRIYTEFKQQLDYAVSNSSASRMHET